MSNDHRYASGEMPQVGDVVECDHYDPETHVIDVDALPQTEQGLTVHGRDRKTGYWRQWKAAWCRKHVNISTLDGTGVFHSPAPPTAPPQAENPFTSNREFDGGEGLREEMRRHFRNISDALGVAEWFNQPAAITAIRTQLADWKSTLAQEEAAHDVTAAQLAAANARCERLASVLRRVDVKPATTGFQLTLEGDGAIMCRACSEGERKSIAPPAWKRDRDAALSDAALQPGAGEPFSVRNRRRSEAPNGFNHKLDSWSMSDWFLAALGELGEAANVAKKLNRVRDGIPGNSETPEELRGKLADELADTAIYLDLLAQSAGFDLETIREVKFAKTSKKIGYIGDGLDATGSPLTGSALAADLADGRSR